MRKRSNTSDSKVRSDLPKDRINGNTILINGCGIFPKRVVIFETDEDREYELPKTKNRRYQLV